MREKIIRALLKRWEKKTPSWVVSLELQILLNVTARAFGQKGKSIWQLSGEKALEAYAVYSRDCLSEPGADPERLYEAAYRTGQRVRRLCGLKEREVCQALVFFLYRNIGILMQGKLPGEVTVPVCYFSAFYASEQCRLMSNVDSGIIAGIFGGGSLSFSRRLTEGCSECHAEFRKAE